MTSLVQERIAINSGTALLCSGLPVEQVLDLLACGASFADILDSHRHLDQQDILACIEFACAR